MTCKEQTIREQLPLYVEETLERDKAIRVEQHLARCADCAEELNLLRLLADEQTPDPGDAFWLSLPDRVYREVRQLNRERSRPRPAWSLAALFRSPWTQGAIAAAAIVLVSWIILRPVQEPLLSNFQAESSSAEELFDVPDSVTELELSDTGMLASWMERESLPLLDAVERVAATGNGLDRPLEEYLSTLDQDQLKGLAASLSDKQEAGS